MLTVSLLLVNSDHRLLLAVGKQVRSLSLLHGMLTVSLLLVNSDHILLLIVAKQVRSLSPL